MVSILPGQSSVLPRKTLASFLNRVQAKHEGRIKEYLQVIGDDAILLLRELTPKDTGKAAGTTQGAKRPAYASHPGFKLVTGNMKGQSGWQLNWVANSKKFSIINPMWEPYLKVYNYTRGGNFVETAARQIRTQLRERR